MKKEYIGESAKEKKAPLSGTASFPLDYNELVARLKENHAIARKFFEIQASVLATLNFEDFFAKLLNTIKEKFGVPQVWLSLVYPSKVATLVQNLAMQDSINRISREQLVRVIGGKTKPILMNKDLERVHCLLPEGRFFDFRSIAITPITLDGQLIGSFNQADPSAGRYHPGIDPSLLAQLGLVVSICLSNVVAHEEVRALAFKDPLTGLLNRRAMEQAMKRELARAKRYGQALSLVFVDLDDFKVINDRFGHDCGDELLVYAASTFINLSRTSDIIARFAGDEFVLILPGVSSAEAVVFMDRIKSHFEMHPLRMEDADVPLRFSYGIASAHEIKDAAAFLKKADSELYEAKGRKKSRQDDRKIPVQQDVMIVKPGRLKIIRGGLGKKEGHHEKN